ncbi:GNAT family N-acetyltransferase [Levilinea saccharolytica]|uniref:Phosphinothricin acetyltransferase n=1 Tax=Levilinea saccharolytica TaxID=229921 RepID=A0A0P6YJK0_9CHLR|nr:GNAT family N-acetyltransferase [Levilinea saccharolytica]KPL89871.1 phosphinothricin acetyltransferase [Levilinea saccharolytica]GAP16443.1 sortase [Levilinea saccharolytica]
MNDWELAALSPSHWPAVRAVYLEGVATGSATFETNAPEWDSWDQHHLAHSRLTLWRAGELAGWAALSPVSYRPVYAGVAEVSVYVAAAFRGQGAGRVLLSTLVESAEQHGIWTLQAVIFPENQASLRLHQNCGFRVVGRREKIGKMGDVWRDTLLLERRSTRVGIEV